MNKHAVLISAIAILGSSTMGSGGGSWAAEAGSPPQTVVETLRAAGWQVEALANGGLELRPQTGSSGTEETETTDASAAGPELAHDLASALAERGWRTRREADGSLLLLPLQRTQADAVSVQQSTGVVPAAVTEQRVRLPLETWTDVSTVAASWLDEIGAEGLRPGDMWRFSRVYLVNILDAQAPFEPRHQIAIGVEDGHVIVLY